MPKIFLNTFIVSIVSHSSIEVPVLYFLIVLILLHILFQLMIKQTIESERRQGMLYNKGVTKVIWNEPGLSLKHTNPHTQPHTQPHTHTHTHSQNSWMWGQVVKKEAKTKKFAVDKIIHEWLNASDMAQELLKIKRYHLLEVGVVVVIVVVVVVIVVVQPWCHFVIPLSETICSFWFRHFPTKGNYKTNSLP